LECIFGPHLSLVLSRTVAAKPFRWGRNFGHFFEYNHQFIDVDFPRERERLYPEPAPPATTLLVEHGCVGCRNGLGAPLPESLGSLGCPYRNRPGDRLLWEHCRLAVWKQHVIIWAAIIALAR